MNYLKFCKKVHIFHLNKLNIICTFIVLLSKVSIYSKQFQQKLIFSTFYVQFMPRLNSKQVYVSTEYKVIIYILEAQINLPHRNKRKADFFSLCFSRIFWQDIQSDRNKTNLLKYVILVLQRQFQNSIYSLSLNSDFMSNHSNIT